MKSFAGTEELQASFRLIGHALLRAEARYFWFGNPGQTIFDSTQPTSVFEYLKEELVGIRTGDLELYLEDLRKTLDTDDPPPPQLEISPAILGPHPAESPSRKSGAANCSRDLAEGTTGSPVAETAPSGASAADSTATDSTATDSTATDSTAADSSAAGQPVPIPVALSDSPEPVPVGISLFAKVLGLFWSEQKRRSMFAEAIEREARRRHGESDDGGTPIPAGYPLRVSFRS